MTKAEIVADIATKTNIEKVVVSHVVEAFMDSLRSSMENGENVYLRSFGSFIIKERKEKIGRNIKEGKAIKIAPHCIPAFKPAKEFSQTVKDNVQYTGNR